MKANKRLPVFLIVLLFVGIAYAATRSLVPRADGEGGLGTSVKNWLVAYIDTLFTDVVTFTDENVSPDTVGEFKYNNTLAGVDDGGFAWYDDDEIKYLIGIPTLPTDGQDDYHMAYDKDTDKLYWKSDADTGGSTKWNGIGDADADGSVNFAGYEQTITSTLDEAAHIVLKIDHTDADVAAATTLFQIQSVDDAPANLTYIKIVDNTGVTPNTVFAVTADGAIAIDAGVTAGGTIEGAAITEGGQAVWNATEADFLTNEHISWGDFANLGEEGVITVADESTDDTCFVTFVTAATGDLPIKSGTNLAFASSTGVLTATNFSGGGASLTSVDAITGDSATAFFDAGTIEHEWGGLQANVAAYTGLIAITGADTTAEIDSKAELEGQIADVADFAEADGDVYTGNADFGGADLEIPQASPAVPDADGEVELDFTDGTMVIQHGNAHAELGAATDVVMGKLIRCWGGTIFEPDGVNDVMTVKAINSIEFPHGVVITAIYLGVSENSNYTLTVQNFDDFDTINGVNPTIDTVAYTADTTGEIIDTTPTYATIAAGQLIMISIPATNVDWIHFEIYYYEPAA